MTQVDARRHIAIRAVTPHAIPGEQPLAILDVSRGVTVLSEQNDRCEAEGQRRAGENTYATLQLTTPGRRSSGRHWDLRSLCTLPSAARGTTAGYGRLFRPLNAKPAPDPAASRSPPTARAR